MKSAFLLIVALAALVGLVCSAEPEYSTTTPGVLGQWYIKGLVGGKLEDTGSGAACDLTLSSAFIRSAPLYGIDTNNGGKATSTNTASAKVKDNIDANDQMSVEAWVRTRSLTQSGPKRMVSLSSGTSCMGNINFHMGQANGALAYRLKTSKGGCEETTYSGVFTSVNTWYHLVLTYERVDTGYSTTYYKKAFVDGVQVGSVNYGNYPLSFSSSFYMLLGNEHTNDRAWDGDILYAAVYDFPLNSTQVERNYKHQMYDRAFASKIPTLSATIVQGAQTSFELVSGAEEDNFGNKMYAYIEEVPAYGTTSKIGYLTSDLSVVYTAGEVTGTHTIKYRLNNGIANSTLITATITVNYETRAPCQIAVKTSNPAPDTSRFVDSLLQVPVIQAYDCQGRPVTRHNWWTSNNVLASYQLWLGGTKVMDFPYVRWKEITSPGSCPEPPAAYPADCYEWLPTKNTNNPAEYNKYPTVPGDYEIRIVNDSITAWTAPLTLRPQNPMAIRSYIESGVNSSIAGETNTVRVQMRDNFYNNASIGAVWFSATLTNTSLAGSNTHVPVLTYVDPGQYLVSYNVTIAASYMLNMFNSDNQAPIIGSPFAVTVHPGKIEWITSFTWQTWFIVTRVDQTGGFIKVGPLKDKYLNARPIGADTVRMDVVDKLDNNKVYPQPVATHDGVGYTMPFGFTFNSTFNWAFYDIVNDNRYVISSYNIAVLSGFANYSISLVSGNIATLTAGSTGQVTVYNRDNALRPTPYEYLHSINAKLQTAPWIQQNQTQIAYVAVGASRTSYTATIAGTYALNVLSQAADNPDFPRFSHIAASPYTLTVKPDVLHRPSSPVVGAGLTSATAGVLASLSIQTRDQYQNKLTSSVVLTGSLTKSGQAAVPVTFTYTGDGAYTATYNVTYAASDWSLSVSAPGGSLPNTPSTVNVQPGAVSGPHSTVSGTGLTQTVAGTTTNVFIQSRDAFENLRSLAGDAFQGTLVHQSAPGVSFPVAVSHLGNGQYRAQFVPTVSGPYTLALSVSGVPVAGSPYSPVVTPSATVASNSLLTHVMGSVVAGAQGSLYMQARDVYSNNRTSNGDVVEATMSFSTNTVPVAISYAGGTSGRYYATYNATIAGTYTLAVTVGGAAVGNATVQIRAASLFPSFSDAFGAGSQYATVGDLASAYINARDAFTNLRSDHNDVFAVHLRSSSSSSSSVVATAQVSPTSTAGQFITTYNVTSTGTYWLHIFTLGEPISGSPFIVPVRSTLSSVMRSRVRSVAPAQPRAGTTANVDFGLLDRFGNNVSTVNECILKLDNQRHLRRDNFPFPTTAVTVCLWYKPAANGQTSTLISYASVQSVADFEVRYNAANGEISATVTGQAAPAQTIQDAGEWMFACPTWRSSDGRFQYRRGGLFNSLATPSVAVGRAIVAGGTLIFGGRQTTLGGGLDAGSAYNGHIGQVGIFAAVFNEAKQERLMTNTWAAGEGHTAGLVATWDFHDCAGNVISDVSGAGLDLTAIGSSSSALYEPGFPAGLGIRLRHTSDDRYRRFNFLSSAVDQLTFSTWASPLLTSGWPAVITYHQGTNPFGVGIGKHMVGAYAMNKWKTHTTTVVGWHLVQVTYDRTQSKMRVYMDNTLLQEYTDGAWNAAIPSGGVMVIGEEQDSPDGGFVQDEAYNGYLDDIALWSRLLAPAEMQALQQFKPVPSDVDLIAYYDCDQRESTVLWDRSPNGRHMDHADSGQSKPFSGPPSPNVGGTLLSGSLSHTTKGGVGALALGNAAQLYGGVRMTFSGTVTGAYSMSVAQLDASSSVMQSTPLVTLLPSTVVGSKTVAYSSSFGQNVEAGTLVRVDVQGRDTYTNNVTDTDDNIQLAYTHGTHGTLGSILMDKSTPSTLGMYNLNVNLTLAGSYTLFMRLVSTSQQLQNSGQTLTVLPTAARAANCVASGAGLGASVAGSVSSFTLQARDRYNNLRTETSDTVSAWLQHRVYAHVRVNGTVVGSMPSTNGLYDISYNVTVSGTYDTHVHLNGAPVGGSPFVTVVATADAYAHTSAYSSLLVQRAGLATSLAVQLRDRFANNRTTYGDTVDVRLQHWVHTGTTVVATVVNNAGVAGSYVASMSPTVARGYQLLVTLGGVHLPGSPLNVTVRTASAVAVNSFVSGSAVSSPVTAGTLGSFRIQAVDVYGNYGDEPVETWHIALTGGNANTSVSMQSIAAQPGAVAQYDVLFNATISGTYALEVRLGSAAGATIKNSPYTVNVLPSVLHAPLCTVSGEGVGTALGLNSVVSLDIDARDPYNNAITNSSVANPFVVTVTDASAGNVATTFGKVSGSVYRATYSAQSAGVHTVNVRTSTGVHVQGSPFTISALPAANYTSIAPFLGAVVGGTRITIGGQNFAPTAALRAYVGGVACTSSLYVSATQMVCVSPAASAGNVSVTVSNNAGFNVSAGTKDFMYHATEVVTSFTPNNGKVYGRSEITVIGANFISSELLNCNFGDTVSTTKPTFVSSTQIVCISPARDVGLVLFGVANNGQNFVPTAAQDLFRYIEPFSPLCRTSDELSVGVPERTSLGISYLPNIATNGTVANISASRSVGVFTTQLLDSDRCCRKNDTNDGFQCGHTFAQMAADATELAFVEIALPEPAFVNEFVFAWYLPCRNQPEVYFVDMWNAGTQSWVQLLTRVTKIGAASLGTQKPCFFIPSDLNDVSLCLDFLSTEVRSDRFRLRFNNSEAALGTLGTGTDGGWLFETEIHGVFVNTPKSLQFVSDLSGMAAQASVASVALSPVAVRTLNHQKEPLLSNDTSTKWVQVAMTRNGVDVTASTLGGTRVQLMAGGVANFTDLHLLAPPTGTYVLTFSSDNQLNQTATQVTVVIGPGVELRRLSAATATMQTDVSVALPDVRLAVYDVGGNFVGGTDAARNVSAQVSNSTQDAYLGGVRSVLSSNGLANLTALTLHRPPAGVYRVVLSASGLSSTDVNVTVTMGNPHRLVVESGLSGASFPSAAHVPLSTVSVRVEDASGAVSTLTPNGALPVHLSVNGSLAVGGVLSRTTSQGRVSFTGLFLSSPVASTYEVSVGAGGAYVSSVINTTDVLQVPIGAPVRLSITSGAAVARVSVSSVSLGTTNVVALDAGNTLVGATDTVVRTVAVSLVNTSAGTTLIGNTGLSMAAGNVSVDTLRLLAPPTGTFVVRFESAGLGGVDLAVTIAVGPAVKLETPTPASVAVNTSVVTAVGSISVRALDAGNTFVGSSDVTNRTVEASLWPGSSLLRSTGSVAYMVNGTVTLDNLALLAPPAGTYTLTVASGTLSNSTVTITVSTGAPVSLRLSEPVSTYISREVVDVASIEVDAVDAAGAVVRPEQVAGLTVRVSGSNVSSLVLGGNTSAVFDGSSARAVLGGVQLLRPLVGAYALEVYAPGYANESVALIVREGLPSQLQLAGVSSISNLTALSVTLADVDVAAYDVSGNFVPGATGQAVTAASLNASLSLQGTTTVTLDAGRARISGLHVSSPANGTYTLIFTASSMVPVTIAFVVEPGFAVSLQAVTPYVGPLPSVASVQVPVVEIQSRDAAANLVVGALALQRNVTIAMRNATHTPLLGGATEVTKAAGAARAQFHITLAAPRAGEYVLDVTSAGLAATNVTVAIRIGPPVRLEVRTPTATLQRDSVVYDALPLIEVVAYDSGGLLVGNTDSANRTVEVRCTPEDVLGNSTRQATMRFGVVRWEALAFVAARNGSYVLEFGTAGMSNTSLGATVAVGPAHSLSVVPYVGGPHPSNVSTPLNDVTVLAKDAGGTLTTRSSVGLQVSVSVNGTASVLTGTQTVSMVSGIAVLHQLALQRPRADTYRLAFAAAGLLGDHTHFAVRVGSASQLTVLTPVTVTYNASALRLLDPVRLVALDPGGNQLGEADAAVRLITAVQIVEASNASSTPSGGGGTNDNNGGLPGGDGGGILPGGGGGDGGGGGGGGGAGVTANVTTVLRGTLEKNMTNGLVDMDGLAMEAAPVGLYTVEFRADGLESVRINVSMTVGAPTQLVIASGAAQEERSAAEVRLATIRVHALDAGATFVGASDTTVRTVRVVNNTLLTGDLVTSMRNGTAVFGNLSVARPTAGLYDLGFAVDGLASVLTTVRITIGVPYRMLLTSAGSQTHPSTSSVLLNAIGLRANDIGDNFVAGTDGQATLSVSCATATLSTNVNDLVMSSGVATLSAVRLLAPTQGVHVVQVTRVGVLGVSVSVTVTPGPAVSMRVLQSVASTLPSRLTTDVPTMRLQALDAGMGNTTQVTANATVSVLQHPGMAVGSLSYAFDNTGMVHLDAVQLKTPRVGTYVLQVASAGLVTAHINVTVVRGPVYKLGATIATTKVSSLASTSVPSILVTGYDAGDNAVGETDVATRALQLQVSPSTGSGLNGQAANLVNGTSVYDALIMSGPKAAVYTLSLSASGLLSTSVQLEVLVGAPSKLVVASPTYALIKSCSLSVVIEPVTVHVNDAGDNFVSFRDTIPRQIVTRMGVSPGGLNAQEQSVSTAELTATVVVSSQGAATVPDIRVVFPRAGVHIIEFRTNALQTATLPVRIIPGDPNRLVTPNTTLEAVYTGNMLGYAQVPDIQVYTVDSGGNQVLNKDPRVMLLSSLTRLPSAGAPVPVNTNRGCTSQIFANGTELADSSTWMSWFADGVGNFQGVRLPAVTGDYALCMCSLDVVGVCTRVRLISGPPYTVRVLRNASSISQRTVPLATQFVLEVVDDMGNRATRHGSIFTTITTSPAVRVLSDSIERVENGLSNYTSMRVEGEYGKTYSLLVELTGLGMTGLPQQRVSLPGGITMESCPEFKSPGPGGYVCLCQAGYFSATPDLPCTPCPNGAYQNKEGQVECEKCPAFMDTVNLEASTSADACVCLEGFFNDRENKTCRRCTEGGLCNQGSEIRPLPGFFRFNNRESTMYPCPREEACLGGPNSTCSIGYTGPLCSVCAPGYGKFGTQCLICGDEQENWTLVGVIAGGLVFMLVFLVRTATGEKSETSIVIKILLNYLQVIAFIGEFRLQWESSTTNYFSVASLSLFSLNLHPVDCAMGLNFFDRYNAYMILPALLISVPFVLYLLTYIVAGLLLPVFGVYIAARTEKQIEAEREVVLSKLLKDILAKKMREQREALKKMNRQEKREAKEKLRLQRRAGNMGGFTLDMLTPAEHVRVQWSIEDMNRDRGERSHEAQWRLKMTNLYILTLLVTLFLAHPIVSKVMFQLFNCKSFSGGGTYLQEDMTVECYTSEHLYYVNTFGYFMLIVYCCGVLVAGFSILYRNRNRLDDLTVVARYRFLYDGYQRKRFFWELVIMVRKLAVVALLTFFSERPLTQLYSGLWMVLGAFVLHVYARPFANPSSTNLESLSLATTCVTLLTGILFYSREIDDFTSTSLSVLLIILNAVVVSVFIVYIVRQVLLIAQRNKHMGDMKRTLLAIYGGSGTRKVQLKDGQDEAMDVASGLAFAGGAAGGAGGGVKRTPPKAEVVGLESSLSTPRSTSTDDHSGAEETDMETAMRLRARAGTVNMKVLMERMGKDVELESRTREDFDSGKAWMLHKWKDAELVFTDKEVQELVECALLDQGMMREYDVLQEVKQFRNEPEGSEEQVDLAMDVVEKYMDDDEDAYLEEADYGLLTKVVMDANSGDIETSMFDTVVGGWLRAQVDEHVDEESTFDSVIEEQREEEQREQEAKKQAELDRIKDEKRARRKERRNKKKALLDELELE